MYKLINLILYSWVTSHIPKHVFKTNTRVDHVNNLMISCALLIRHAVRKVGHQIYFTVGHIFYTISMCILCIGIALTVFLQLYSGNSFFVIIMRKPLGKINSGCKHILKFEHCRQKLPGERNLNLWIKVNCDFLFYYGST